nr:PREDICTED: nucleoside diphosphate-linked moiety X motif 6 isoform X3 [Latimeria chalumnae]|eukprot:XP_005994766.1 PREDICTED: nucleoside diphosphate-linked moiety X motif 6 isoform X3 [Latimeria chalumnae]
MLRASLVLSGMLSWGIRSRAGRVTGELGRRWWAQGPAAGARPSALRAQVDKFGGVTVHLQQTDSTAHLDEVTFGAMLKDSLTQWKAEGRAAVWLHVPILQSRFIPAAASQGFRFHHAEKDSSTLTLWLGDGNSRLPMYATHQVGVAGAVLDETNGQVLVVQDRNKTQNAWKFPGGLSDPGEDIGLFSKSLKLVPSLMFPREAAKMTSRILEIIFMSALLNLPLFQSKWLSCFLLRKSMERFHSEGKSFPGRISIDICSRISSL